MTTFCPYCFTDGSLQSRLKKLRPDFPKSLKCDFHPNRSGIPAAEVAELVDGVIRENYVIGETIPRYDADDDRPDWVHEGDTLVEILDDAASPDTFEITEALAEQLINDELVYPQDGDEPFYADDQQYVLFTSSWNPNSEAWSEFKSEITHSRRFFSEIAVQRLEELFRDIHFQSNAKGQRAVYILAPEDQKQIFRVRQIDDPDERGEVQKNPAKLLGMPPPRKRSAGRMNAAGVGAFYGAFDRKTCIAEVRPPVGCVVMGAAFQLIRPITVLDTTRFAEPMKSRSIFSPVYQERLYQWKFMKRFMNEMRRPILPDDTTLDYIPTQAVSEFIHSRLEVKLNGERKGVDGIIFSSAQHKNGLNIVLFGDAALLEHAPQSSRIASYEPDADEVESWTDWKPKKENPALRLVERSVFSRRVTSVEFQDDYHSEFDWEEDE